MKDMHNNIDVVSVLNAVVVSATQTITDIDLQGANSAELIFDIGLDAGSGLSGSHKLEFTLQDSDDGTTYSNVEDADMLGVSSISSGVILTVDATSKDETLYHFGYVGGKRYLQIVITETGTCSCPISISLIKGNLLDAPVIS